MVVQSPSLDKVLKALELRAEMGEYHPSMARRMSLERAEGRILQLNEALRDSR